MALVKYGGGIVQMSGSLAGNTFARNRSGNYARARTKPVNPKSARQSAIRAIVMMLAEQWRETPMTDVIRTAWKTYADSVQWNNKLGEVITLSGFNHFIRSNAAMITAGGAMVTAGPTDLGLPAGDPTFDITGLGEAAATASVVFNDTNEWCDEDDGFLSIFMGEPQNPTRNFFDGPWRFWQAVAGDSVAPPTTPDGPTGSLPFTAIEGQKVWFQAQIIRSDGRVSTRFECDPVTVVA